MSRLSQNKSRAKHNRRHGSLRLFKRRRSKKPQSKKPLKPSDLRRRNQLRRRNVLIFKISLLVTLVLGSVIGLWKLARLERFSIQKIDVRGVEILKEKDVEEIVEQELEGSIALFFPRKNTFFVPRKKISTLLRERFIAVDRVNIIRKGSDELIVVVQERQPSTIFCEEAGRQIKDCYFADKSGILYRQIPHFARSQFPIIYFESTDEPTELGSIILSEKELGSVFALVEALPEKGDIKVSRITLRADGSIKLQTDAGYALLVSIKEDYGSDLSRFLTTLQADVFKEGVSISDVELFDLRYGRKVFYEFRKPTTKEKPDSI